MTDERKKKLKTVLVGSGKEEGLFLWLLLGSRRGADTVRRRSDRLHRVLFIIEICLFFFGLARLLLVYGSLPEQTGIHFKGAAYIVEDMTIREQLETELHGYQPIDLWGKKIMLFYPFVISGAALIFDIIIPKTVNKLSKGRSSENGEVGTRIKAALQTALDISALAVVVYFSIIWNEYIIRQLPMRIMFTSIYALVVEITLADLILYSVIISKRYKNREEK